MNEKLSSVRLQMSFSVEVGLKNCFIPKPNFYILTNIDALFINLISYRKGPLGLDCSIIFYHDIGFKLYVKTIRSLLI